nr:MAG TPA_asm: RNA-binding protein [Caudoviricetes sp.]
MPTHSPKSVGTLKKKHKHNNMSKRSGNYRNKIPPFKPDPEHYTRKQHSWKAKEAYETEDDAWEYLNQNPKLRAEGMTAYRCRTCQKWHVGHKG